MIKRAIAGVLGLGAAGNGAFMLAAGRTWYETIPDVVHTGPFNPHFVADIGAAYFAGGLALVARAWRGRYWPAAMAGAGFFLLHALIHALDIAAGHSANPINDAVLVIVPALLAFWTALPDAEA
jgi:hypothetical protein